MRKIIISSLIAFGFLTALSASEYSIDTAHSSVGFSIKHMSITKVNGKFTSFDAIIDADKDVLNRLEAVVKTASVNTENKKRDDHLRQDNFFSSDKFADMKFVMKEFKKDGDDAKIVGDLTIKDVTKSVEFDYDFGGVADVNGKEKIGFSLETKINRSDFNFAPQTPNAMLSDEIKVVIDIQAVAK
ncbi:YceI family protein [Campylobacter majalis]|uniref:YceI family protein n=1 Tax=Campylobacter majalis TaxID=2790656 RepID=UPI003D681C67